MRVIWPLLVLVGFVHPVVAAENWPQFRGPQGDGITAATDLPASWSEAQNIRWKTAVHGRGWSSPVIWEDQIWMTTAPEDGKQLYAVCVDRQSGRILHDKLVFEIAEPQFCYPLNSYASCTPVVEGNRVWVHYGVHGTACLDAQTAEVLWTRQDLLCDHHRGPASSPIIYGDLLVVAFDGFDVQYVVAFDKHTGRTVWQRDRNIDYGSDDGDVKKAYGTAKVINVGGQPQLIYPSAGATIAYEPSTGAELWRFNHGGMNACMPPIYQDGLLYLNSASGGLNLFAMRVGGRGKLSNEVLAWKCDKGVPKRSSASVVGDLVFMVSDAGVATVLDSKTGKALRQQRLEGEFSSSPLVGDGRVYLSNQDGAAFVLSADRDFELLATNRLESGTMSSPAVFDKAIYWRTKTHLYRIEK